MTRPNPWFTFLYGAAIGTIAVGEVAAVVRSRGGETLTQHWVWIDHSLSRWPVAERLWRTSTAGFLGWLIIHFIKARIIREVFYDETR